MPDLQFAICIFQFSIPRSSRREEAHPCFLCSLLFNSISHCTFTPPRHHSPMTTPLSSPPPTSNRGWTVTFAGTGINLALGVLYTWSMFKAAIGKEFGWKDSQLNDPYALCCLVFAFSMILAGRCQDKLGPRLTASLGGLFVGAGLILISTTQSYGTWVVGFGILVGLGL